MAAWSTKTVGEGRVTNAERTGVGLPDVPDEWAHLPRVLIDMGTCGEGINGAMTLTWESIDAYARRVLPDMSAFEARALHRMSGAYASVRREKDPACPSADPRARTAVSESGVSSWHAMAGPMP